MDIEVLVRADALDTRKLGSNDSIEEIKEMRIVETWQRSKSNLIKYLLIVSLCCIFVQSSFLIANNNEKYFNFIIR